MENASEALKMSAFFLIFLMALSISINAFGLARRTAETILNYRDREYDYTYVKEGKNERIVSAETIIPSIYKAYKENYKIVFKSAAINGHNGLYQKKDVKTGNFEKVYSIDLEKEVLGSDAQKEDFIKILLYGVKTQQDKDIKSKMQTNLGIILYDEGIYDIIKGKTFVEKLGIYYQEELHQGLEPTDANKTQKRVITYIQT